MTPTPLFSRLAFAMIWLALACAPSPTGPAERRTILTAPGSQHFGYRELASMSPGLAVAYDDAGSFFYPSTLDSGEAVGAVFFSPPGPVVALRATVYVDGIGLPVGAARIVDVDVLAYPITNPPVWLAHGSAQAGAGELGGWQVVDARILSPYVGLARLIVNLRDGHGRPPSERHTRFASADVDYSTP